MSRRVRVTPRDPTDPEMLRRAAVVEAIVNHLLEEEGAHFDEELQRKLRLMFLGPEAEALEILG